MYYFLLIILELNNDNVVLATMNSNINLDMYSNNIYLNDFVELANSFKCEYFTEDAFCQRINDNFKKDLLFMSLNLQSLPAKWNQLLNFFDFLNNSTINPDFFAFQECWKISKDFFDIPGYNLFHKCREERNGGGVGFFVKKEYFCKVIENSRFYVENIFEAIALQVEIPNVKSCIVVSLYRPPAAENMNTFFESLIYLFETLNEFKIPVYLFTDSNINFMNIGDNINSNILFDHSIGNGYFQLISKCTRIAGNSRTLIDQIFTSHDVSNISKSGVIIDSMSDHFITFCCVKTKNKITSSNDKFSFHRNFSSFKKDRFLQDLSIISWDDVYSSNCPTEAYNYFWDTFKLLFDIHFPLVRKRINKNKTPVNKFMTQGLLKSRKTKLKLARKAKINPSIENIDRSRTYRNIYNSLIRKAKKLYFKSRLAESYDNSKKLWQVINEACNKRSKLNSVDKLRIGENIISDPQQIANHFNEHFSQVGKKTVASLPTKNVNFRDYLPPPNPHSFFMLPTAPGEVLQVILGFTKKESCDVNDISFNLLQKVAFPISKPLSHIFNLSIETGIFPEKMKISKTIPIFKNGSPLELENHRGVSIVDSFSKIYEKLASTRLIDFLTRSNFFYDKQFAFLKGRSTNHAILQIFNYVTNSINSKKYTLAIFLDVAKAFDSVDHQILFSKLENAGVRGLSLKWFKSFLSNRKQKVKIGKIWSSTLKEMDISVLQGSIIGVILFLIFVNDLYNCDPELFAVLFADDLTSLISHDNIKTLNELGNKCIDKLLNWYTANKLAIHPGKSRYMIFKAPYVSLDMLPKMKPTEFPYFPLFLNMNNEGENNISKIKLIKGVPNESETSLKVLGILIDQHLNLQDHAKAIHSKVSKNIYMLNQVKNVLDSQTLKLIYFAHIHSHLNYCSNILNMCTTTALKPLIVLQKKAIRMIFKLPGRAHTAQLFIDNEILPLNELIDFTIFMFMFDFVRGNLPLSFDTHWSENGQINLNNYALRNATDLHIPRTIYKYLDSHPLYNFAKLWNDLPNNLKVVHNRNEFECSIKNLLVNRITV